jgi:hypothetical protein
MEAFYRLANELAIDHDRDSDSLRMHRRSGRFSRESPGSYNKRDTTTTPQVGVPKTPVLAPPAEHFRS